MRAKTHPQQTERLKALRRFEILDTAREAEFDEIVNFAAELCGTKISVINLVDEERQWFKAETGLGIDETPLETSICSHVILETDFVEIHDTLSDTRTSDNPLCTDAGGLRFYAGAILKTSDGFPIGTVCVLDDKPQKLTPLQRNGLKLLAHQVMRELELRLAIKHQNILSREMDHRVKNSLQTVASLVRLYKSKASPDSQDAFDAVARRVEAISLLHQELHQTSDTNAVPLHQFIPRVVDLLKRSTPSNIEIRQDTCETAIASQHASAFAVIISEFVANSVKHGFSDGRDGIITINLSEDARENIRLDCRDNGLGRNAAPKPPTAVEGLGERLVNASAAQLGGVLKTEASDDGYTLTLEYI